HRPALERAERRVRISHRRPGAAAERRRRRPFGRLTLPLVDYLIARDGMPPRCGQAYDYVLGGDGLYLSAENRYLDVRVPVAPGPVRGLAPLYPACTLRHGRLPQPIWDQIVAVARADTEREVLLVVSLEPSGYQLLRPAQIA